MEARSIQILSLSLLLFSLTSGVTARVVRRQKTWCIAKPSSDDATLLMNLNFACSKVDCSMLHKGSSCFHPDTLVSHASLAMNLYYQTMGRNYWNCDFKDSGLVVSTDPSSSTGCAYGYVISEESS